MNLKKLIVYSAITLGLTAAASIGTMHLIDKYYESFDKNSEKITKGLEYKVEK